MITEIALIPVAPASRDAFLAGWKTSEPYFAPQPGYLSHSLDAKIEDETMLVLRVDWESLDAHKAFMASADYTPFMNGFKDLMSGAPEVFHVGPIA